MTSMGEKWVDYFGECSLLSKHAKFLSLSKLIKLVGTLVETKLGHKYRRTGNVQCLTAWSTQPLDLYIVLHHVQHS